MKFETDAHDVNLRDMLSEEAYTDCIQRMNDKMKPARSTSLDGALLITGPLLVPLALWGVRHSSQVRRRKKYLYEAIQKFNDSHPELLMRWNRSPDSMLTIERRNQQQRQQQQSNANNNNTVPVQQHTQIHMQQQHQTAIIYDVQNEASSSTPIVHATTASTDLVPMTSSSSSSTNLAMAQAHLIV